MYGVTTNGSLTRTYCGAFELDGLHYIYKVNFREPQSAKLVQGGNRQPFEQVYTVTRQSRLSAECLCGRHGCVHKKYAHFEGRCCAWGFRAKRSRRRRRKSI